MCTYTQKYTQTYIHAHTSVHTSTHVVAAVLSHIPAVLALGALPLAAGDFPYFCFFTYIFKAYVHMISYSTILQVYMGGSWLLSSLVLMLAPEAMSCECGVFGVPFREHH